MENNNLVVKSLWIDNRIGPLQELCMKSYPAMGHIFHLYTYQKIHNLPPHIVVKDANDIVHKDLIFKDTRNSYATFSDLFRIVLLHKAGGWWVDCDTVCLKKLDFKESFVFATERDGSGRPIVCNAVIKMPKESAFGKKLLDLILATLRSKNAADICWTEIGAMHMDTVIRRMKLHSFMQPPEAFCPVDFQNFEQFLTVDSADIVKHSYIVHLWQKMWEANGTDPKMQGDNGSFIENIRQSPPI
ncbi:capsular polysaccharide synthesis protein [Pedobacter ginsengisoli]|uniref:capsular polysaccharide synthesis protein n=1 Tax=Pedobacter ginsengisoli TaxID=363852 RepID=UPI002549FD57|nr:capsular polysaccharide synthesis protein [Pedobacter ginsengisoli]